MASFSFIHVTPELKTQVRISRHNSGADRPPEAITRAEWDHRSTVRIAGDERRAEAVFDELTAVKKRGRPGAQRVRFLFGHPPAFEAEDAWDKATLMTWAQDSAAWLERKVEEASDGHAVVERVDLHVDETRPHLHATVIPAMPKRPRDRDEPVDVYRLDPGPSKLSWTGLQRSWSTAASSSLSMRAIQDGYHADVGANFGMIRGELKSESRAEPDRLAGLITRVKLSAEKADRERRRAAQTRRAAAVRSESDERRLAKEKQRARGLRTETRRLQRAAAAVKTRIKQ